LDFGKASLATTLLIIGQSIYSEVDVDDDLMAHAAPSETGNACEHISLSLAPELPRIPVMFSAAVTELAPLTCKIARQRGI
jgi:hypothetical protein